MSLPSLSQISFSDVIEKIENQSLSHVALTFLSVVVIRNFLEVFTTKAAIRPPIYIHYVLSYLVIALSLTIFFYLATGDHYQDILKLVLTFFSLILIVPLIDLVASGGQGLLVGYLFPANWQEIVYMLLTGGGSFSHRGLTVGVRIEAGLILILSLYYIVDRTQSWVRGLVSTIILYFFLFLFAFAPNFAQLLLNLTGQTYTYSAQLMVGFYLALLPPLVMISLYFTSKKLFKSFLISIRPYRTVHYLLLAFLGLSVAVNSVSSNLIALNLLWLYYLIIAVLFSGVFLAVINNLEDLKLDANRSNYSPLFGKLVSRRQYIVLGLLSLIIASFYALALGFRPFYVLIAGIGVYYLYSAPPFHLKRYPILAKLMIGFVSVLVALIGFSFTGTAPYNFPVRYALGLLLFIGFASNFIDIKDYHSEKGQIKTLPTLLGLKKSKLVIGSFFLISLSLAPYFFHLTWLTPVGIALGLLEFWAINRKEDKYDERLVFLFYFPLLLLLIYLL